LPLRVEGACGTIALFDVGGTIHAIEDGCLRCGSTLVRAVQDGAVATCPGCGWRYDVSTGCVVGLPALRLATFRVRQPGAGGA
jgi:nitrite reductase/ring-hydroxylating ferredoxin subunit